jgi:beta-lactamase superfamily II metal-dependent hydrolase
MPDSTNNTSSFENLLIAIEDNNIPVTVPILGERFTAGLISMAVLAPVRGSYDNLNNDSLVLKLIHGETAFLFTGDAEHASERDMLAGGYNLHAQVLKAGHHGSRTATSEAFLDAVMPRAVVVTCGYGNAYGHPHTELLESLERRNIPLYRTDEMGTVVMTSDGQQIRLIPVNRNGRAEP